MNLKLRILFIVAIITAVTVSMLAGSKPDANTILDKATRKINVSNGTQMDFTISGPKINQSGSLIVKGRKFRATTPIATIWYDGKTQWTYNKNNDEVNIATPSASDQQSMNPYHFLNLYKQGYTKSMTTKSGTYEIHLVGKGKKISEMYVTIDKYYNLKQIKVKQNGGWMTITVRNLRNKHIADSAFRFNSKDYPKAEIIDLR